MQSGCVITLPRSQGGDVFRTVKSVLRQAALRSPEPSLLFFGLLRRARSGHDQPWPCQRQRAIPPVPTGPSPLLLFWPLPSLPCRLAAVAIAPFRYRLATAIAPVPTGRRCHRPSFRFRLWLPLPPLPSPHWPVAPPLFPFQPWPVATASAPSTGPSPLLPTASVVAIAPAPARPRHLIPDVPAAPAAIAPHFVGSSCLIHAFVNRPAAVIARLFLLRFRSNTEPPPELS